MIYCNQRRIQVYPTVPISREEYLIVHPTYAWLTLQFDFNRMYWNSIMILQLLARQVHTCFFLSSVAAHPQRVIRSGFIIIPGNAPCTKMKSLKNVQCKLHNQSLSRVALAHHVPAASLNHYSQIKQ